MDSAFRKVSGEVCCPFVAEHKEMEFTGSIFVCLWYHLGKWWWKPEPPALRVCVCHVNENTKLDTEKGQWRASFLQSQLSIFILDKIPRQYLKKCWLTHWVRKKQLSLGIVMYCKISEIKQQFNVSPVRKGTTFESSLSGAIHPTNSLHGNSSD